LATSASSTRFPTADDRRILHLAVPALAALVAEPLFLLGDAVVVGRLGTTPLAGLGIAATVLQTAVGLCVFLAYGTTAAVSRAWGAGDLTRALRQGVDGIWLATALGVLVTALGVPATGWLVSLFDPGAAVSEQATTYLQVAFLGTTPLLLILATTGVLRGLQDTRTPLLVAVAGNLANLVLNVVLVHGLDLGIVGSAIGSVVAQTLSAAALVWVVVRGTRRDDVGTVGWRPRLPGVVASARAGVPLLVRTLTLRAALVLTTYAVTIGAADEAGLEVDLAAHQLAMTLWGFLALALDAVAIAAQALTGAALGAGDLDRTRALTRRMVLWGLGTGLLSGLLLAATSPVLGPLFTPDERVHEQLLPVLLVAALAQPLAGLVFVLDGVLIGAGDGRYLAVGGLVALVVYAPVALLAAQQSGLVALWVAFAGLFMAARAAVLVHRARGDAWTVTGAGSSRP